MVQRREQVAEAADALGRAQDQQAAGVQGVVHQRQELLLRLDIDVDQEVPATEDVQLGKRRIDEDVLRRKDHQVADLFLDPVALALTHEEPRQPLGRHVRGDARGERALAGLLDGVMVDVGGKDLDRRASSCGSLARSALQALLEHDGQRIGLLAGRATGVPHPQGAAFRPVLEQARESPFP